MYRSFYSLNVKPFQISSDPAFLWLGEKHKEALATLRYGIMDNKGFLLLTGDVGTGKTTLINSLITTLGSDVICTTVPDPSLEKIDFYNFVARGFGATKEVNSKGKFLVWLTGFLHTAHAARKKVLLIIDEAQLLTQELLEEIRLLSNVELAQTKLLNIFFVGQNEFNEILAKPINRAVRQRLTLNYNIEPLGLNETAEYIEHRLKIAGTQKTLFTAGAVREICTQSQGFPRRINVLCDHALLTGYVQEKRIVDEKIIKECARELDITLPERHLHPVATEAKVQPQAEATEPHPVQESEAPMKKRRQGRVLYFVVLLLAGLLILTVAVLFSEQVQNLYASKDQYFAAVKAEIAEFMTNESPAHTSIQDETRGNLAAQSGEPDPAGPGDSFVNGEPGAEIQAANLARPAGNKGPFDGINAAAPTASKGEPEIELTAKGKSEPEVEHYLIPPLSEAIAPPEAELPSLQEKVVVRFNYNNNDFTDQGLEELMKFAESLVLHPEAKISIIGYTDTNGNQNYNKKLSEFRANIVKSFLLGKGADSDQMETRGMGSENPIAANDSVQGRMLNRRVEIKVVSHGNSR